MHGRTLPPRFSLVPLLVFILLSISIPALFVPITTSAAEEENCLGCHAPEEEVVDTAYQVDPQGWTSSVHHELDLSCTDCHEGNFDEVPHEKVEKASCTNCHDDAEAEFSAGVHGAIVAKEGAGSPFGANACTACHGTHDVRAVDDSLSSVYFRNIPTTCGKCHGDVGIVQIEGVKGNPVDEFARSVHGYCLENCDKRPAVCTDCHGSHDIRMAKDPNSGINPFNIAKTCGNCHTKEDQTYSGSVHGTAFQRGVSLAPTCTTCHGVHTIAAVTEISGQNPSAARLVRTTCPACHESKALMNTYGIAAARVSTYRSSYHGLASARGNTQVADCASCHGIHNIYPSSDPRSTVAPANLETTCGQCHPGAGKEFAKHPVHFDVAGPIGTGDLVVLWVKRIYWVLILGVLGGMFLHNLIILIYYVRKRWREEKSAGVRIRFARSEIIQHSLFVLAFITLAFTGFMLAYPNEWWARAMMNLGLTEVVRRNIHRVSAVVMITVSLYHMAWAVFTPYGRSEIKRILPRLRDVRELIQNMRFHLGKSEQPAAFSKFDYPGKAEYWALVWGTVVMALTGLVLWFPVVSTSLMPSWIVNVATVVHLFEAWLATLAILIFHFFFVIFHPEVYPLSFAMLRGTMPSKMAAHHHPAWTPDMDAPAPAAPGGKEDEN